MRNAEFIRSTEPQLRPNANNFPNAISMPHYGKKPQHGASAPSHRPCMTHLRLRGVRWAPLRSRSTDRSGNEDPARCGCLTVSHCIPRHNMTRLAHIVTERREDKRRDREEERREKSEHRKENAAIPRSEEGEGEKSGGESSGRSPRFFPFPFRLPFGFWRKTKKRTAGERPYRSMAGCSRARHTAAGAFLSVAVGPLRVAAHLSLSMGLHKLKSGESCRGGH